MNIDTLDLLREVRFSALYAFKYSPRPGTAAPRLGGVDLEELPRRRACMSELDKVLARIDGDTIGVTLTSGENEFRLNVTALGVVSKAP